jgi:hypothetical protein
MFSPLQVFRSLLNYVSGSTYRYFSARGRSGETIDNGRMYQHYGFRSNPPKDTELATLKWGNNIISVAENDGNTAEGKFPMGDGEVRIYSAGDASTVNNIILNPAKNTLYPAGISILIEAAADIYILAGKGKVSIQTSAVTIFDPNQPTKSPQPLLTTDFLKKTFLLHTHDPSTGAVVLAPDPDPSTIFTSTLEST